MLGIIPVIVVVRNTVRRGKIFSNAAGILRVRRQLLREYRVNA